MGGGDLTQLEYDFSGTANNGNVLAHRVWRSGTAWSGSQGYSYDALNRLSYASESGGWNRTYGYDRYGNRHVTTPKNGPAYAEPTEPTLASQFNAANNRLNMTGASYDASGNQTAYDGLTLEYDAEGRNTKVKEGNSDYVTFAYDGEGRRVKKVSGGVTTYYIHDALGRLAAEYTNQAPASTGVSYLFTDMLGSVRTITNASGAVVECYDYMPFGRMLTASDNGRSAAGCYPAAPDPANSRASQKFTGKERDAETGLDFFGARYMSGAEGRFMTPDPSMLSTVKANPQSWNRYTYTLNNPLRYVDPNGELWIASGNTNQPYSWVDECQENQTCHESIAASIGNNLRVYGSRNAADITDYLANEHGMIDVEGLSGHADANFRSVQRAGFEENYLGVAQAAAFFNVAAAYGQTFLNDSSLVFTGGSTATGGSAIGADNLPIHQSHRNGANIDIRYMGADGATLTGNTAAANGEPIRNRFIMDLFAQQNAGLGAVITGDPARYGFGPLRTEGLRQQHRDHMHFQMNYPRREEPIIRPGQR
jgi:RHS repeat-associated protein